MILGFPFPPSTNTYWRMGSYKRGKVSVPAIMISAKGRQYRADIETACRNQGVHKLGLDQQLRVEMVYYPPDLRTRDTDNYRKALWDALTHAGVWIDDSQVREDAAWWGEKRRGGAVILRITPATGHLPAWATTREGA